MQSYDPLLSGKAFGGLLIGCFVGVILLVWTRNFDGPYYLGCADRHGSELVLQTDKKPHVEGSIVYIGDDVFVVPEPGMTCRIVTVKKLNEEKASKKVDNPI